jgi:hypothetical protein
MSRRLDSVSVLRLNLLSWAQPIELSVSVFRWNLLSWAQSIELVRTSGHQRQHKMGYKNQAQHKPNARVKIKH